MSTKQKRMIVRKLQGLRDARLGLAEIQVGKARAACEEAARLLAQEEERLQATIDASHEQYRQLDEQLKAPTSMLREKIYEWRGERQKVADGIEAARERVQQAHKAIARAQAALEEARGLQRVATVNVHRTKMLAERMR
jgi:multidrug resistance efflux pump